VNDSILHVVLLEPEIPLNAGSIGRTCVAAGAKLWLVRPLGFRIDDRRLRRAGLDYWRRLSWEAVDDWIALMTAIGPRPMWFIETSATRLYTEANFQPGDAIVFGPETRGIPPGLLSADADRVLRLPMQDHTRSLNLSNAASVVVFEALRQIHGWPGPAIG
jgi:tRNA (cytidine/uridine-2'-O-)-methyltransferase